MYGLKSLLLFHFVHKENENSVSVAPIIQSLIGYPVGFYNNDSVVIKRVDDQSWGQTKPPHASMNPHILTMSSPPPLGLISFIMIKANRFGQAQL